MGPEDQIVGVVPCIQAFRLMRAIPRNARRYGVAAAGVFATLVLVFVPTSAVHQLSYNNNDMDEGSVSGMIATSADADTGSVRGALTVSVDAVALAYDGASSHFGNLGAGSAEQVTETGSLAHLSYEPPVIRPGAEERTLFTTARTSPYIWPAAGTVTSYYGYRSTDVGSPNHKGLDISSLYGDPIYAAREGEVVVSELNGSFGYMVQIKHENGDVTLYAHCSELLVSEGERVKQGQQIAEMGNTGTATGVHVHFELIVDGENVDPLPYLQ